MIKVRWAKIGIVFMLMALFLLISMNKKILYAETVSGATLVKSLKFDGSDSITPSGNYQIVDSADGSRAVRLSNNSGTATQYIDLGAYDLGSKSISIAMWVKVDSRQIEENNYCSLISNKNWDNQKNPGFMVATSYTDGTFKGGWVDFGASGNNTAHFTKNLPNFDGYWHSIVAVFDRNSNMSYYVDGELCYQMDISALKNASATGGNIFVGCDTNKKYGVLDTIFDNVEVYDGVMSAEQIAGHANPILLKMELDKLKTVYEKQLKNGEMTIALRSEYCNTVAEIGKLTESASGVALKQLIERTANLARKMLQTDEKQMIAFNAIADIHIDGATASSTNDVAIYEKKMQEAFTTIGEMFPQSDAVLIPGDYTRNGKAIDFTKFYDYLERYNTAENVLMSLGNHEMKGINDFNEIKSIFINGMKPYVNTDNVYYDKWIGGYHFISLSSETNTEKTNAYLSDAQLSWFESKLAENARSNMPIYVILHQPLKETFPLSSKYSVGAQDEKLKTILKKYPQTILISGHLHNGYIDDRALIRNEWGHQIDLASIKQNDLANQSGNIIYRFETYANRTVVKIIDYVKKIELYELRKVIYHSDLAPNVHLGDIDSAEVKNASGEVIANANDHDVDTGIVTNDVEKRKHEYILDLKGVKSVSGLRYRALTAESTILQYDIEYSYDGKTWLGFSGSSGKWEEGLKYKVATFQALTARFIKLIPITSTTCSSEAFVTSVAEFSAIIGISEMQEIRPLKAVIVDKGIDFEELSLPATVHVKMHNGLLQTMDVTWKIGDYNKNQVGTYVIYGEISPMEFILNHSGVAVTLRIRVG